MTGLGVLRLVATATAILVLSACAQRGERQDDVSFSPHASLNQLDDWQISGRLALSNGRDGGSGELSWSHQHDSDVLRFHAAFGQGSWRLDIVPQRAMLRLSDGNQYQAPSIEALIDQHLDWNIPVTQLSDWLKGIPSSGPVTQLDLDLDGRIRSMSQSGWRIEYGGYLEVNEHQLPRKITVRRDGQQVRLLIRQWTIDR